MLSNRATLSLAFLPGRIVKTYQDLCGDGYDCFYKFAACAYKESDRRCVNLRMGHDRGHQDQDGEIFDQGDPHSPES